MERLRIADICKKFLRLNTDAIRRILSFTAIRLSGKIKNPNNDRIYEVDKIKVQMAQTSEDPEKLELRLDDVEHTEWFNQKEKRQLGKSQQLKIEQPKRSRGIRM